MFCDEHGTVDFCPECLDDDKQQEIDRLRAELEQRNQIIDAVWEAVGSDLMGDSLSASVVSIKEDRAKAEARVRELEEIIQHQSRDVRSFSNPDTIFEAIPVRAFMPEQETITNSEKED